MQKYLNKISGPLLDRIDLHVEVTPVSFSELSSKEKGESSKDIRKKVILSREIQEKRFSKSEKTYSNSHMSSKQLQDFCKLDNESSEMLKTAMEKLDLSARAYNRILKVSRTIADLDDSENIESQHIAEAIQYRSLDREGWAG